MEAVHRATGLQKEYPCSEYVQSLLKALKGYTGATWWEWEFFRFSTDPGESAASLGLTGFETFDILNLGRSDSKQGN